MKTGSSTPQYSELYQQKFLDAFPPRALQGLSKEQQSLLSELNGLISDLTYEALAYRLYTDPDIDPEKREKLADEPALHKAMKRWDKPFLFEDVVKKLRNEHPDRGFYEIDPETLQSDEVLFLTIYPFWNRVHECFFEEFALDGSLGKYLRLLKKLDTSGYPDSSS